MLLRQVCLCIFKLTFVQSIPVAAVELVIVLLRLLFVRLLAAQFCEGTIMELVPSGVIQLNLVEGPLGLSSIHIRIYDFCDLQDKNKPSSFIRVVWFLLLLFVKSAFEIYTKTIKRAYLIKLYYEKTSMQWKLVGLPEKIKNIKFKKT